MRIPSLTIAIRSYIASYYCSLATIVTLERYPHNSIATYLIRHCKVTMISYSSALKLYKGLLWAILSTTEVLAKRLPRAIEA